MEDDLVNNEKEYKRIHILLDQACHPKIVKTLDYASSEEKIVIPNFKLSSNGRKNSMRNSDQSDIKSELDDTVVNQLLEELEYEEERNKAISLGSLCIMVAGINQS
jgi:hypothetical protein